MVYKIIFAGSNNTGKTNLATSVEMEIGRRSDLNIQSIREAAKNSKETGLPINEETTLASQLWILHSWCRDDILYSTDRPGRPKYDLLILDRGPENYCYLENKFGENPYALNIVLGHLQLYPYDKLYLLPIIDENIVDNGVRSTNPTFRQVMEGKITSFFEQYKLPYTPLPVPEDHDHFRDIWTKIVVNDTLCALGKEKYLMR